MKEHYASETIHIDGTELEFFSHFHCTYKTQFSNLLVVDIWVISNFVLLLGSYKQCYYAPLYTWILVHIMQELLKGGYLRRDL